MRLENEEKELKQEPIVKTGTQKQEFFYTSTVTIFTYQGEVTMQPVRINDPAKFSARLGDAGRNIHYVYGPVLSTQG